MPHNCERSQEIAAQGVIFILTLCVAAAEVFPPQRVRNVFSVCQVKFTPGDKSPGVNKIDRFVKIYRLGTRAKARVFYKRKNSIDTCDNLWSVERNFRPGTRAWVEIRLTDFVLQLGPGQEQGRA